MLEPGELLRQTVCIIPLLLAEAVMGYRYMREFLSLREGLRLKRPSYLWVITYFLVTLILFIFLLSTSPLYDLIWIAARVAVILLMQRVIFRSETYKQLFCLISLLAGIYLLRMLVVFINIWIFELYTPVYLFLAGRLGIDDTTGIEKLGYRLATAFMFVEGPIYAVLLYNYLRQILRRYKGKGQPITRQESGFLILPCLTCIVIALTLRWLITPDIDIYKLPIYDARPALRLWVPLICVLLLATIIACVSLYQRMLDYREEARFKLALENQISRLREEVSDIEGVYTGMRALRHDLKNHISNIVAYINSTDASLPELKGYTDKLEAAVGELDFSFNTGNPISDVIVHQKSQAASNAGIEFESDFFYPGSSSLDAFDIGIILDNALDNALEAAGAARAAGHVARIYIRSYIRKNSFFIEVRNNYIGDITFDTKTALPLSLKGGELHGIGLSNIKGCAGKYLGDIDISLTEEDGGKYFTLLVMLSTS